MYYCLCRVSAYWFRDCLGTGSGTESSPNGRYVRSCILLTRILRVEYLASVSVILLLLLAIRLFVLGVLVDVFCSSDPQGHLEASEPRQELPLSYINKHALQQLKTFG